MAQEHNPGENYGGTPVREDRLIPKDQTQPNIGPETTIIRPLRPDWGERTPVPQSGPPKGNMVQPLPGWPHGME
jgi:hypothetical protein